MARRRKWMDDEFPAVTPTTIRRDRPVRRPAANETVDCLHDLARMIENRAAIADIEIAVARVRGHLNFIREYWKMSPTRMADITKHTRLKLELDQQPTTRDRRALAQTPVRPWEGY